MRRTFNALSLMAFRSVWCASQALAAPRAPGVALVQSRTATGLFSNWISTQQRFTHDTALSDATRREMEEELSRSGKPEEPKPPLGWRVEHTPGRRTFELSKNYEDEKLLVYYYPKEDGGDSNSHQIMVQVTRNNQAMQVDLSIEEGELVLDNIRFYPNSKLAEDESAEGEMKRNQLYPGPKLSELDDALVDSFISYLDKRGVNEELGEFVILYSFWSEQQEYERWLSSINKFVS
ncbi:unnamed protein product [Phytomonas sp. Hart1]|nr:unnamed protein product [Phytomonas sp. Hart1]|eukprot:CCW68006.1 unnamed protein product [Phytomonas sp. isolate Hart1]